MLLTRPRARESLGERKKQIRIHWVWEEPRDSADSPAPGDAVLPAPWPWPMVLAESQGLQTPEIIEPLLLTAGETETQVSKAVGPQSPTVHTPSSPPAPFPPSLAAAHRPHHLLRENKIPLKKQPENLVLRCI